MSLQGSLITTEGGRIRPPITVAEGSPKRTSTACLRGQPEGPGPVGQGPGTRCTHVTGYGAKPVGFPCWMSRSTPARHIGKERPIRGACRRASPVARLALDYPTAHPHAPRSLVWRDELKHHGRRKPVDRERASGSGPSGPCSRRRRGEEWRRRLIWSGDQIERRKP